MIYDFYDEIVIWGEGWRWFFRMENMFGKGPSINFRWPNSLRVLFFAGWMYFFIQLTIGFISESY